MESFKYQNHSCILIKASQESSLIFIPDTNNYQFVPNTKLKPSKQAGIEPLGMLIKNKAAEEDIQIPTVNATALGFLFDIQKHTPIPVQEVSNRYTLCESNLLGLVSELQATNLLTRTSSNGITYYKLTDKARQFTSRLRCHIDLEKP